MVKRHYGIVNKDFKLVHFYYDVDEWELYDRKNDPNEMKNVYDDHYKIHGISLSISNRDRDLFFSKFKHLLIQTNIQLSPLEYNQDIDLNFMPNS